MPCVLYQVLCAALEHGGHLHNRGIYALVRYIHITGCIPALQEAHPNVSTKRMWQELHGGLYGRGFSPRLPGDQAGRQAGRSAGEFPCEPPNQ